MKKFKTGDKVKLKIKSPIMIVHSYRSKKIKEQRVTCQWFNYSSEIQSFCFLEDQLRLIKPKEPEEPKEEVNFL